MAEAAKSIKKKRRRSVYSGIGGQAVLEGVMMRNKGEYAVAIRKPDGEIDVRISEEDYDPRALKRRIPFVRGIFSFINSLMLGMELITYSAGFYEEEEASSAGDKLLDKIFKDKAEDVVMAATVLFSIVFAIALFMLLPYFASELLGRYLHGNTAKLLLEGALRILVFILYVALIALMKDIRRLYQYHGAEHKCINCVESGRPLNVENAKKSSRFHKRCGTSFMLFVVMLGVICCFFIRTDKIWLRILLRIAIIPLIAGISYELLQLAGKRDSFLLAVISAPGLWLQRITTKEPDDEQLKVAIASVEAVFDWQAFQHKHFETKMVHKMRLEADGVEVDTGEETVEISILDVEEELKRHPNGFPDEDWSVHH